MVEFPRDEESKLVLAYRSMMGIDLRGTREIGNLVIKNWIELLACRLEERGDFLKTSVYSFITFKSDYSSFPYRIIAYYSDRMIIARLEKVSGIGWQDVEQFDFNLDHNLAMSDIGDDEIDRARKKLFDMILNHELNSDNWSQLPHWMGDANKGEHYHGVANVFKEDFP